MSGALIVVEGPDYVGKTTTVQAVSERLKHVPHVLCREPGGTPFSNGQRALILDKAQTPSFNAEVFAFLAAKADLLDKVIYPALREGKVVLCDRYTRSLLAYQGGIRGFPYEDLMRLLAHGGVLVMPHLEILLEASPDVRAQRRAERLHLDRMDQAGDAAGDRLVQGYKDASIFLFAQRTLTFDTSTASIDDTADAVTDAIHHYLKFHDITHPTFAPLTHSEWEERITDRQERRLREEANYLADGLSAM